MPLIWLWAASTRYHWNVARAGTLAKERFSSGASVFRPVDVDAACVAFEAWNRRCRGNGIYRAVGCGRIGVVFGGRDADVKVA